MNNQFIADLNGLNEGTAMTHRNRFAAPGKSQKLATAVAVLFALITGPRALAEISISDVLTQDETDRAALTTNCKNPAFAKSHRTECDELASSQKFMKESEGRMARKTTAAFCDGAGPSDSKDVPLRHPTSGELITKGSEELKMSVLSEKEATEILTESKESVKATLSLTYMDHQLCQDRAQKIACDLERRCKVKTAKIFLEPVRGLSSLSSLMGDFSPGLKGFEENWKYHVANVVYVKSAGGEAKPFVIDLYADKTRLIPYAEWIGRLQKNARGEKISLIEKFAPRSAYLLRNIESSTSEGPCQTTAAENNLAEAAWRHNNLRRHEVPTSGNSGAPSGGRGPSPNSIR